MVTAVAVVAEQKLVVVVGGAAHVTRLALDALPAVLFHVGRHDGSELQAGGMSRSSAIGARDQLLRRPRLLVLVCVAETEVAVVVGLARMPLASLHRLAAFSTR